MDGRPLGSLGISFDVMFSKVVVLYVSATYVLTFVLDYYLIRSNTSINSGSMLIALRMWIPGLLGLILALKYKSRETFSLIRKIPALKWSFLSYVLPVFVGALSLFLLFVFKVTELGPNLQIVEKYGGLTFPFFKVLFSALTLGFLTTLFACLGEELGWRGFLQPQLKLSSQFKTSLVVGTVWAIWHWPLILFSDYATSEEPLFSLLMFTVLIITTSIFIGWNQARSQSIWPAVVFHAAHNLWIIGIYPAFFKETKLTPYLVGESGVFLVVAYLVSVLLILRKKSAKKAR